MLLPTWRSESVENSTRKPEGVCPFVSTNLFWTTKSRTFRSFPNPLLIASWVKAVDPLAGSPGSPRLLRLSWSAKKFNPPTR